MEGEAFEGRDYLWPHDPASCGLGNPLDVTDKARRITCAHRSGILYDRDDMITRRDAQTGGRSS